MKNKVKWLSFLTGLIFLTAYISNYISEYKMLPKNSFYIFFGLLLILILFTVIPLKTNNQVILAIKNKKLPDIPVTGFILLAIYIVFIYLPEFFFNFKTSDKPIDMPAFLIGFSLTVLIFIAPFLILTKWRKAPAKTLLYYYVFAALVLIPGLNFTMLNIEHSKEMLNFLLQPSLIFSFGFIPWLISILFIPNGSTFFSWERDSDISTMKLIFIGTIPISILFAIESILGNFGYKYISFNALLVTSISFFLKVVQEELFYRGVIFGLLSEHTSTTNPVFLSSLIFTLSHWSNYLGLPGLWVMANLFMIGIAGYCFTLLYSKSKSLWWSVFFHWLYNMTMVWLK